MTAVFWDLDDTLVDTIDARLQALEFAYDRCIGGKVDGRALWQGHRGGTIEALGQKLMGANYRRFVETYRERYFGVTAQVKPYSGVPTVLETLAAARIPMLVVTSKVSWGATDELQRAGLLQYFHSVVGFDDTDVHKPEPEPVYEAMDRLLIDEPGEVMFVGDSPADVRAAKNAGCTAVGALWGTLEANLLTEAGPDYVAAEPFDVLQIVRDRLGESHDS